MSTSKSSLMLITEFCDHGVSSCRHHDISSRFRRAVRATGGVPAPPTCAAGRILPGGPEHAHADTDTLHRNADTLAHTRHRHADTDIHGWLGARTRSLVTRTQTHARAHTHTHTRGSASGPTPRAGRPGQPGADAATVLFGVSQYRSAKSQHRFVHTSPCVRPDAPVEGPGLPQAAQASESVPSESDGWRAGRADIRVGRRRTARGPPPAG